MLALASRYLDAAPLKLGCDRVAMLVADLMGLVVHIEKCVVDRRQLWRSVIAATIGPGS